MQPYNQDSDLVHLVRHGDKQAFDRLMQKYQFRILKLINHYVKDPSEAMDVTQESFIRAFRALDKFRGESAFYTWLYRIAINTAKHHVISRNRQMMEINIELADKEHILAKNNVREYSTPEKIILRDEIETVINQAIQELPKELRMAIVLREMEGMSYQEIASTMSCPIGTIRSRIFRARLTIERRIRDLNK